MPIYAVGPFQINFMVPMNSPISGTAEIQVVRPSTGRYSQHLILSSARPHRRCSRRPELVRVRSRR